MTMKIYTKTGDAGETGLWGGQRVAKDALRVHAYGTVDECNAAIGLARMGTISGALDELLNEVQNQLFVVGADLATPGEAVSIPRVSEAEVSFLETSIDQLEDQIEPLKQFILPGGTPTAAHLHLARTVCRRAERWVVSLVREDTINPHVGTYLNRLSDFLFVAARVANAQAGLSDVPWQSPRLTSKG